MSIVLEEGRDKLPRHQAIERQCRYQGKANRPAGTHVARLAGSPHKNRHPATHSTNEEENNERKKKYASQYVRKNKKGKESATGECREGYTTRSGRGCRTAGHAEERTTRIPTSTCLKREEVRANLARPPQP